MSSLFCSISIICALLIHGLIITAQPEHGTKLKSIQFKCSEERKYLTSSIIIATLHQALISAIYMPQPSLCLPTRILITSHCSCCCFPWSYVHEGSWRADAQCSKQKFLLLCWMDPQQRHDQCLWHPTKRSQDGLHLRWQHHRHPGDLQADFRTIFCHVQKKSFPSLVHR